MLGKTSISAIRALLLLAQQPRGACWSPRRLAESLNESPTYMAKVTRHLVRSGILEAEKGVKGGVRLLRDPQRITLLHIAEACHGAIVGDYCNSARPSSTYCAFHRAAAELHDAITGVLERWSLADLLKKPESSSVGCLMSGTLATTAPVRIGASR